MLILGHSVHEVVRLLLQVHDDEFISYCVVVDVMDNKKAVLSQR